VLFLNEAAVGIGYDGEVWIEGSQRSFKKRIKAIPAVLARCVDRNELVVNLGMTWAQDLLNGYSLRSQVMHSLQGKPLLGPTDHGGAMNLTLGK
jgi:hypothetical protein